ncbi:SMP-30/gluconolactonase/LRE family protein [Nocardia sp. NPDC058176]|uniref:SMP-30/gluconolactonase/LRE family protein n=1 Tax=Nocardia sp. NPDC058176 TaxID=3346368 RepID=UPI0036DD59DB
MRCLATALAAITLAGLGSSAMARAGADSCAAGWQAEVVAADLGGLENLEYDGDGGFYVSGIVRGELLHVDADGGVRTVLTGLDHPAGLRLSGDVLYFLTGDGSTPEGGGTLQRLHLPTGEVTVLLPDLVQPNGLLLLPDGDLLISQLSIPWPPVGISRYRPATGEFTLAWSTVPRPNGLALTPDRRAVLTEDVATSQLLRIPLDAPNDPTPIATLTDGLFPGLDDLDVTAAGRAFVTGDFSGSVYQVDTATGAWCTIATGWSTPQTTLLPGPPPIGPTSARLAPDATGWSLYVTSIDGTLRRLRPPPTLDITPPLPR